MHATIRTGKTDGIPTSYNLFFANGLRLRCDMPWTMTREQKDELRVQFGEVVIALRNAGIPIAGDIEI